MRPPHPAPGPVVRSARLRRPGRPGLGARLAARTLPLRSRILVVEQLSRLLAAGLPPALAVAQVRAAMPPGRARDTLDALRQGLESGGGMGDVPGASAVLFGPARCGLVQAGERTGRLPDVLHRVATGWRRSMDVRRRLLLGLAYPGMLVASAAFLMPLVSLASGGLAAYARDVAREIGRLGLLAAAFVAVPLAVRAAGLGGVFRRLAWRLPVVRAVYRRGVLSDSMHALATALAAGLGIHDALAVARTATPDPTAASALDRTSRAVAAGAGFADAVGATGLLPRAALVAVAGGEDTGTLAESVQRLSEDFGKDYRDGVGLAVRAAGVAVLVVVAGVVAARVLGQATMLLPGGGGPLDEIEREILRGVPIRPLR